jgi:hypothetical protein
MSSVQPLKRAYGYDLISCHGHEAAVAFGIGQKANVKCENLPRSS